MRLRRSEKFAERCTLLLADALGFGETVTETQLDFCRAAAFSSKTSDEFAEWYLRSECLSKYSESELPEAERNAYASFWEQEDTNYTTNQRLGAGAYSYRTHVFLMRACSLITRVMNGFSFEEIVENCSYSSGATAGVGRKHSAIPNKWHEVQGVTELPHYATLGALPYAIAFRRYTGSTPAPSRFTIIPGDTVTTVTKSWKTRRTINCQPSANLFFQKGVGLSIRRRLRKVGLLHPNAQETQRVRARQGSVDGLTATIDLKNASTSVTTGLVKLLIEGPLHKAIFDLRADGLWDYALDDESRKLPPHERQYEFTPYEMISTMGNGFTFELETLLFWALTAGVATSRGHHWSSVTVYGDDIICPTDCVEDLLNLFDEVGLVINTTKSFWEGPFRESCGGHYWNGDDVTPFYLKEDIKTVADVIQLGNKVFSWRNARDADTSGSIDFDPLYSLLYRDVPKTLRGPVGVDGCLWSSWDQAHPRWCPATQNYRQTVVHEEEKSGKVGAQAGALSWWLWQNRHREADWLLLGSTAHSRLSDELRKQFIRQQQTDPLETSYEKKSTRLVTSEVVVDKLLWSSQHLSSP